MDGYQAGARLLRAMAHPVRLRILEALKREGEACVCHLERLLGHRQATMSQHLARLRAARLVADRRDGPNVFYPLGQPSIVSLLAAVRAAAERSAATPLDFAPAVRDPGTPYNCQKCATLASLPLA